VALQVEINPEGMDEEYLRCLNTCFPNWGGEAVFDWVFRRSLPPDPLPDRFVLREEGQLLAGSTVTYRTVSLPNNSTIRVGIMTGSWTLAAARGRGCFSRVIEESVRITQEREGALLLAFVTHDNPSCRQLQRAGAALFPTSYLIADPETAPKENSAEELLADTDGEQLKADVQYWAAERKGQCSFKYSSFEAWSGQFVVRPWETIVIRDGAGSFAILEKHAETDRINALWGASKEREHALLNSLRTRASIEGRKLFSFSMDAKFAAFWREAGLAEKPGSLTAIIADARQVGDALRVATSEMSIDNQLLADRSCPLYLGSWSLQSGDRM
jgi:hypothetical protein